MRMLDRNDEPFADDPEGEKEFKQRAEMRRRLFNELLEKRAEMEMQEMPQRKLNPVSNELLDYFNSLEILFDTAEMVAGDEDYLVIQVDREAYRIAQTNGVAYDRSREIF